MDTMLPGAWSTVDERRRYRLLLENGAALDQLLLEARQARAEATVALALFLWRRFMQMAAEARLVATAVRNVAR